MSVTVIALQESNIWGEYSVVFDQPVRYLFFVVVWTLPAGYHDCVMSKVTVTSTPLSSHRAKSLSHLLCCLPFVGMKLCGLFFSFFRETDRPLDKTTARALSLDRSKSKSSKLLIVIVSNLDPKQTTNNNQGTRNQEQQTKTDQQFRSTRTYANTLPFVVRFTR